MNTPLKERQIKCPKCFTISMRKSIFRIPTPGKEYFCDKCHLYFGIDELVNRWNYDLGDFCNHLDLADFPPFVPSIFVYAKQCRKCLTIFFDEPVWRNKKEHDRDYDEVTALAFGIPAWENEEVDYGCTNWLG